LKKSASNRLYVGRKRENSPERKMYAAKQQAWAEQNDRVANSMRQHENRLQRRQDIAWEEKKQEEKEAAAAAQPPGRVTRSMTRSADKMAGLAVYAAHEKAKAKRQLKLKVDLANQTVLEDIKQHAHAPKAPVGWKAPQRSPAGSWYTWKKPKGKAHKYRVYSNGAWVDAPGKPT